MCVNMAVFRLRWKTSLHCLTLFANTRACTYTGVRRCSISRVGHSLNLSAANVWNNFERSMKQVLPNAKIVPLDVTHPIFNSFFKIETLKGMHHPDRDDALAEYKGIYEDNDPSKRLMVIINYNNDIGDYMEWSGQGYYAINFSNDAYKLATNYVVYGLTH